MPYTSPSAPLAQPHSSEALFHPHTPSPQNESAHPNARSFSLPHAPPHRPQLPRSYSSQSYLRRHRRSPSYSKAALPPAAERFGNHSMGDRFALSMTVDPYASLRQSPPPRSNTIIPSGAVISPPESVGDSSDEEASPTDVRGVDPIDAAIRSLQAKRKTGDGSEQAKNDEKEDINKIKEAGVVESSPVPALTPEARKISHSRSTSTESSLVLVSDSSDTSSNDGDREEDSEESPKPPMVRKKSGELVRPALRSRRRPSSMPGTPVFAKNVHFDSQLEHIRHFLQLDKPLAVSANTSPVETYTEEYEYPFGRMTQATEWQIRMPNFPSGPRKQQPVRLERMFVSPDNKNLVGVVSVANLAFQKTVVARFTVDYWKTVSEVTAEYNHDIRRKQAHDGYDRFDFNIQLSDITDLGQKTLFLCIRYSVGGQDYWDNNEGMNYQVEFPKNVTRKSGEKIQQHLPTTKDHGRALPRSRHNPSTVARPRSMPPTHLDDFGSSSSSFPDSSDRDTTEPDLELTAADSHDWLEETLKREKPASQGFSVRYNFGLSLSAAKSSGATEDRTALSAKAKSQSSRAESPTTAHAHPSQPSAIVSSKPHLESPKYKELVDKYCFFGSAKRTDAASPLNHGSSSSSGNASPEQMPRADKGITMNLASDGATGSYTNSSSILLSPLYRGNIHRSHSGFLSESQPAAILG